MNKNSLFLLFFLTTFSITGFSQNPGYKISIKLTNFQEKEVYIAQYYGEKPFIMDTVRGNPSEPLVFQGDEALDPGVYFVVLPPKKKFLQLVVNKDEQHFELEADANQLRETVKFKGSADNSLFYDYLSYYSGRQSEMDEFRKALDDAQKDEAEVEKSREALKKIQLEIVAYKREVVKKHPESVTAAILKADLETEIPEFEGTKEEVNLKKYYFKKEHYFDNVDLADGRLLRSPVFFRKADYFINKLTIQTADSLIPALDRVLILAQPTEENFKYLIVNYLNVYSQSNILDFDRIFVHLVENYCEKGLTPFIEEKPLKEVISKARKMKPLLIGKKAPQITTYKEDSSEVDLYDIEAEYTVLIFWRPECGTCQKSMPDIIKFYESYKDKGIKVFTVCTDMGEKAAECWKFTKQKDMADRFINTNDAKNKSRFYQKYDVRTTPKILILDKNKEIVVNRIGGSQLGTILNQIIERKESENNE